MSEKLNLVHAARYFGKSYDAAQKLYHEIQKADKTILFRAPKGDVHILPNDKLEEIKAQAHQAGVRDGEEKAWKEARQELNKLEEALSAITKE